MSHHTNHDHAKRLTASLAAKPGFLANMRMNNCKLVNTL